VAVATQASPSTAAFASHATALGSLYWAGLAISFEKSCSFGTSGV